MDEYMETARRALQTQQRVAAVMVASMVINCVTAALVLALLPTQTTFRLTPQDLAGATVALRSAESDSAA